MSIEKFLKPEWKKLILPIAFIILLAVTIDSFYYLGSVTDKYGCNLVFLFEDYQNAFEENNSLVMNQTYTIMTYMFENMTSEINRIQNVMFISSFVMAIDPITPVPCEFISGNGCEFYTNEETYNCFKNLTAEPGFLPFNEAGYKKASLVTLGLNFLLLFIEGYLISSVILFAYRKMKVSSAFRKISPASRRRKKR